MEKMSDDILLDDWEDALLEQLIQTEEQFVLTSSSSAPKPLPPPPPPPPSAVVSFSPPRELSQRPTTSITVDSPSPSPTPNPISDNKDLEIDRLKRELEQAAKQIANLEKERVKLKKERDKKEDQLKSISSRNEENACTKFSKSKSSDTGQNDRDFGTHAPNSHKISSKFQNGVSSNDPIVETTFKAKGVEIATVSHQEAQGALPLHDDLSAYLDLSQKLLAIWGSPTDNKMGTNVISKLLVGCQRDFHNLFGCMNMSLPSEITRDFLSDLSSSGVAFHYLKDRFHTPEAAKLSNFYLALTKIADGTGVLETLIEPLLDLSGMENVVIIHSSLCVLHMVLKLLLELEKNVGRRNNVFIEGLCVGKGYVDSGVKDGNIFNEEIVSRQECQSQQNSLQPRVNWIYLFEIMHQIAMKITEERVRVEVVSIMKLHFLRSNAYFERERFSQKIVFETISELLKKDAGLSVKKHALRLLYLVLNCPKLLAAFCCGCKEGDDSSAMDVNGLALHFQNFKIILQGLSDCVATCRGGLLELKVSRNAILVLAFLASSGQLGFEIFVGHKLSCRGVNYLMLILQLLVSEMDLEAGAHEQQPEIFRERTFLIREILILLNRLVSNPSYSATVLRGLMTTRDMAGLTIDVASRLSRKEKKTEQQDSMVKHIRETEIVDLARLFKKRVFTYLGDDL
ncbi:hypothetical protein AAZX31_01G010700 [Glycine max]|uniref:Uncharacterized protein n=1 Tax=Glycine max TaxID=3847 RepID=K7K159_SOYBN|nr:protein SENSITIVE TO UV 2 isoform X1 [Glycine max]KRH74296.1 hypothetical protein GLYMA_01G010800v4 [Glycine max]|eukprot:XP_006572943.1 uncharacterized protein LOC102661674 isoform X1 [Glycine max]